MKIARYAAELHKVEPLPPIPDSIANCKRFFAFLRKDYTIKPSNIALFTSKENFNEIANCTLLDRESPEHR